MKGFLGAGEWSDVVDLFLQFGGPASRHGSDFFEREVQEAHEFERPHGAQGGQFGAVDGPAAPLGGEFLEDAETGFEGVCEGAVEVEKDQFEFLWGVGGRLPAGQRAAVFDGVPPDARQAGVQRGHDGLGRRPARLGPRAGAQAEATEQGLGDSFGDEKPQWGGGEPEQVWAPQVNDALSDFGANGFGAEQGAVQHGVEVVVKGGPSVGAVGAGQAKELAPEFHVFQVGLFFLRSEWADEKFVIGDGALDEGGEDPELQVGIEGGVGAAWGLRVRLNPLVHALDAVGHFQDLVPAAEGDGPNGGEGSFEAAVAVVAEVAVVGDALGDFGMGDLQDGSGGAAEDDGLFAVELPHDGFRAEQAFVRELRQIQHGWTWALHGVGWVWNGG